eukprot:1324749-Amorphochlora_amoeboformis.AAC.1
MMMCGRLGAVIAAGLAVAMGLWVAGAGAFEEEVRAPPLTIPDLQGKTAMITGANTGLGLMAAKNAFVSLLLPFLLCVSRSTLDLCT